MDYSHLECFCSNLRNKSNLETFTVGFNAGHINQISELVKKEVNYELNNLNCDKIYFLNYHLTEIGMSDYDENFNIENINEKLFKYNVTFQDILHKEIDDIYFNEIINTVNSEISDSNPYKATASSIQQELNELFIGYFKFDMIKFIETKISLFQMNTSESSNKINWIGKKTHIGYILSNLALKGFIDTPKNKNGEINFTAFAKLIKQNFEVDVDQDTLRKYLNPEEIKYEENKKTFDKAKFNIPNIIEVS